jgi:deoxyadenosine/deoxycytidine kinase
MNLYLEGNIGAGKTTLTNILGKLLPSATTTLEPVDHWMSYRNADGRNLLDLFYSDIKRYSYLFQSVAFRTRILALEKTLATSTAKYNLFERSVYADRFCFAQNCYEGGNMSKIEWDDYTHWFDWLCQTFTLERKINGFIYVKTSPEVAYQRLIRRNRHGEESIPLEYLKALSAKHDQMMSHLAEKYPVLVIDGDQDFKNDESVQAAIVAQIIQKWPQFESAAKGPGSGAGVSVAPAPSE